jgi:4-amino-4-deoxy-L-arabinose transferase-like glycosyltransferase
VRSAALDRRPERALHLALRWPPLELWPLLLLGGVLVGCAWVLATTEIGSGDYGQWLMTARPYLGESVPDYRAASAVPPVMPFLLSIVVRLVSDQLLGVHLFAVLLLVVLGLSAYLAGHTFFASRLAGLVALVGALLLTDRFLELFAFGGLLQAGAIVFLWLGAAALMRAGQAIRREWAWWIAGGACIGLAALTHVGTASIVVPTGIGVGLLSAMRVAPTWRLRVLRLAPLGTALVVVAAYWLVVLLPGGTEFAQNPASLAYRGPNRLVDNLTSYWPGLVMVFAAVAGLAVGTRGELRRRAIGPWTIVAAWTAITLAVVIGAVVTGAATDYPRFATPLLAPLVIAAAGAGVAGIARVAGWLATGLRRGTPAGWSVALAMVLVAATAPPAVTAFGTQANGYQMAEPASLQEAVSWIEGHVPPGATILAPVREGKWIEGLSGRATLFSSAVRYSFRPEEWGRSLAADTLLRSGGALVNEFFFVRLTDDVANATVPRGMVIGVNHGGEYLDLLRIAAGGTSILGGSGGVGTLATLPNLAGEGRSVSSDGIAASVASTWSGKRQGAPITFSQIITVQADSSTLEVRASAATLTPTGFAFELHPAQVLVTDLVLAGAEADLTFDVAGSGPPRLRAVLSGASATLERLPDGGLRVRSSGGPIRLLITDLSGAGPSVVGAQFLEPGQLLTAYHVGAVLLVRDPAFDGRRTRLEALGFHLAQAFGPYAVMVTP